LISGYGFLQRAGVSSFGPITIYETNLGRITGTIANPAFLAVYLLFNVLFALLIAIDRSIPLWRRAAAGASGVLIFTAYTMTGVRGAFVGLIASGIVFFAGSLVWETSARLKRAAGRGFLAFVALLAALYAMVGHNEWVTRNFGRLFRIDLADSTIQTRLISWRGGLSGFWDNFWFGVGPQKFDIVFNQHFDPRFYSLVGDETWWDRAHNMTIEVAVTMGIFGLLAYLGVGAVLAYSIFRMGAGRPERRTEALIIISFLVGYFIQNLFVFDTVSSYVVLSVLVGYIVSTTAQEGDAGGALKRWLSGSLIQLREFLPHVPPRYWWAGGLAGLGLMAPIAYAGNIALLGHNKLFLKNLAYANIQPFSQTISNYKTIFEISNFDSREVVMKLAQFLSRRAFSGEMTLSELRSGYSLLLTAGDRVVEQNPKDVRLLLTYANSLNVYGEVLRAEDPEAAVRMLRKSEQLLTEAATLGPSRLQVFHSLANTYLVMGEVEKGIATLEEAVAIQPTHATTHWLLAFAYVQNRQIEPGIAAADAALDNNYQFKSEAAAGPVANVLAELGDWERLLRLYRAVARDTQSGAAQAKVAATLAHMGRTEEAIAAAREAGRIDPSLKNQVEEFVRAVQSGEQVDFFNG
ncbi:MAG: O-antigen ligase family protein, partial [Patescibacteria group bacterium]|nr:O-antigen ligase family protein [Patescibacteria group bacterium]